MQNRESVHLSLIPEVGNLKYRAFKESVHLERVHLERVDCNCFSAFGCFVSISAIAEVTTGAKHSTNSPIITLS